MCHRLKLMVGGEDNKQSAAMHAVHLEVGSGSSVPKVGCVDELQRLLHCIQRLHSEMHKVKPSALFSWDMDTSVHLDLDL